MAEIRSSNVCSSPRCNIVLRPTLRSGGGVGSEADAWARWKRGWKRRSASICNVRAKSFTSGFSRGLVKNSTKRTLSRLPINQSISHTPLLKIPVWWRRAVLPSLPWVVCFLSFFLFSISHLVKEFFEHKPLSQESGRGCLTVASRGRGSERPATRAGWSPAAGD